MVFNPQLKAEGHVQGKIGMPKTKTPAGPVPQLDAVKTIDREGLARFFDMSVANTYLLQKKPGFPAPLRISGRPRWLVSELVEHIRTQAAARPAVGSIGAQAPPAKDMVTT